MTITPAPYVREATENDLVALILFLEPFVKAGRLLPRTRKELDMLWQNGFIAIWNDDIVGFAALEIYSPKLCEIRSLAVLPEFQGMGIGRKLVAACVQRARAEHILEVMAITSSEEFFRNCGFDFTLPGEKKALFLSTGDLGEALRRVAEENTADEPDEEAPQE